jgi:2-dehydro-3-deoxyphosphogluconate aldolase/(4S)-4-hydroxy-2-oxoglutarate aldolase
MNNSNNIVGLIKKKKIIAIIRGITKDRILKTAEALLDGGISIMEVTMNNDDAFESIQLINKEFEKEVLLGAGTVLTTDQVEKSYNAGAKFIVSPNIEDSVVSKTKKLNMISIPGAFTPTEIYRAYNAGADFVKVFPAGSLGPEYIKSIKAPLENIPLLTVGGVDLNNLKEFINAGAVGVGIGGNLVNKRLIYEGEFEKIKNIAKNYVDKLKEE